MAGPRGGEDAGARRDLGGAGRARPGVVGTCTLRCPTQTYSGTLEEEPTGPSYSQTSILSSREKVRTPWKLPERLACLDFFSKGGKYLNWRELWESWGEMEKADARGPF